jgi:hypothetical protein
MASPDRQKGLDAGNLQSQIDELKKADKQVEKDVERRLTTLEESVRDMRKSNLDSHKWFVTFIFGLVGLFLAYTGNQSRIEVRDATRDMKSEIHETVLDVQTKVDKATAEMAKNFQNLAGESLKKPVIELYNESIPLDGKIIEISPPHNIFPAPVILNTLFVKNIGDKRSEPLSIRISLAGSVQLYPLQTQGWQEAASFEKDFPASFYSTRHDTVAPKEMLNIHPLTFDMQSFPNWINPQTNLLCKIQVFYGGENAAEAQFRIRLLP